MRASNSIRSGDSRAAADRQRSALAAGVSQSVAEINRVAARWHALIASRVLGSGPDPSWTGEIDRLEERLDELFSRKRALLNAGRTTSEVVGDRRRRRAPDPRRLIPEVSSPWADSDRPSEPF